MTMQDIATAGVAAQAAVDEGLTAAYTAAQDLTQVTVDGIEAGMVKPLAAKLILAKARELEGAIAHAARLAAELHIEQTKVCKDNNADTGALTSVGGITVASKAAKTNTVAQPDGGGGR